MGEEGAYNKYSGKLGLSLVYGFGLEFEAAHVDVEGGALTGNGGGMNGGDGYDWEFYRIGLSRDLIAGFSADASYYMNSEEDYYQWLYLFTMDKLDHDKARLYQEPVYLLDE